MNPISEYLKEIEKALKAGNSTEHTHRPALKRLIESIGKKVTATNEPQRIACGSPDFIITRRIVPLGYIEAKDIGIDLKKSETSPQLERYRASLRNLILTDYLEFRFYKNGEFVRSARLGKLSHGGTFKKDQDGASEFEKLIEMFLDGDVPTISSPKELAERMARLARLIHDLIQQVFMTEGPRGDLHAQYDAFRRVLIDDLTTGQFADMYAQTIAYGMFAARCNHNGGSFSREHAGSELPKTNPFLRKLFNTIAGADLDERISWAVDDLAELLARADMAAILEDFGQATRQEDPVVHFYETFLAAYDPKMRELRGVYYTPEPVVGYIVRSVDALLRSEFGLNDGLADNSKVSISLPVPNKKGRESRYESHRVQVLDPACGTGTFLHSVIAHIKEKFSKSKGVWPSYVAEHLLPRLYGFELLMAPYAVAHMKLGLQLEESGYDFASDERLRVFLTNSLEEGSELADMPLFAQWLADEAAAAADIKRNVPIMVVIGNPPYSGHSANKGPWIESLMEEYKQSPELKKPAQAKWLSDDYVKFLRFAQWRIEQTGYGVLGFITNHSWLDNPTFLDMRASFLKSFDKLFVLDLHGNSKKKESSPDREKDKNVFDIQQGVAISLFVRMKSNTSGTKKIYHADLWGDRASKYEWLESNDALSTRWKTFQPRSPKYIFVPQDERLQEEYEQGWRLDEAMNLNGAPAPGIVTTHDEFAISSTKQEAINKVEKFLTTENEGEAREIWRLCSQNQWNYVRAKNELSSNHWRKNLVQILYRPFDMRWTVYDRNVAVHRRERVSRHLLRPNLAFVLPQQTKDDWSILVTAGLAAHKAASRYDISSILPLWLFEDDEADQPKLFSSRDASKRRANFSSEFLTAIKNRISGYNITPEDVFSYIYAVLSSPSYRTRYSDFLKRDFPRVPLPRNAKMMNSLVKLGQRLIDLHLLRVKGDGVPAYPVAGNNRIDRVSYEKRRIYINSDQYFDEIAPAVWQYNIGGYQVAQKWLKDRKDRQLTFNELQHYIELIAALDSTLSLEREIDAVLAR